MFNYPRAEKLKSRKEIDLIFTKGQSVAKYPVRLAFSKVDNNGQMIRFGVSVSKKHFKKAVDRNYVKRLLRECYRLNKHLLIENLTEPHAFMLLYQSKEMPTFNDLNQKVIRLFQKFAEAGNRIS